MKRSFWFGKVLPTEFDDPAIKNLLSFNGQLHFRCSFCNEVTWGDITFAKSVIRNGSGPCPSCKRRGLSVVKFASIDWRACKRCGTELFAPTEAENSCGACGYTEFTVNETTIQPSYPRRLFVLIGRETPFGKSVEDDVNFLAEYVRALRMSPQFHRTCVHLVAFIDSIFECIYGSSPEAANLPNLASGLMRTVYRETGDLDAAYFSIAIMAEARDLTLEPLQRAVFGFNINQNVYSVLAQGHAEVMFQRFHFNLKEYGVSLSKETLASFEAINEDWLAELRARQKWLLGDILKAGDPTASQIEEALQWFDKALKDPALPKGVVDYVRESALSAKSKRQSLTPSQQRNIKADLDTIDKANLANAQGLQRIRSLVELLRGQFMLDSGGQLRELALQSLGESIIYAAANDPQNMLRYGGSVLSRLVAGFAAERMRTGAPLEGIAGVEAFRSLALRRHEGLTFVGGHHVSDLELRLMTDLLFGNQNNPIDVANEMLSKYKALLNVDLQSLLDNGESVLWCDVWESSMLFVLIKNEGGNIQTEASVKPFAFADAKRAFSLPMADSSPGRLRARQLENALRSGWPLFESVLKTDSIEQRLTFVGSSIIASWPLDAAEALEAKSNISLRPIAFAPSIQVASNMRRGGRTRSIDRVLLVSYGGADLKGIASEVKEIELIYGSRVTVLDGARIGKSEVIDSLSQLYDVIHFCGHGDFDYLQPMESRIYFNDRGGTNCAVTASEILGCGSMGREPIVVLSACTSAMVLPNGSNNFLGLAGALIKTGASAIIGARWPISDDIGGAFSMHCHLKLASGESVTQAVKFAKNQLRTSGSDEWAAFMSIGG